jgi:signal transduction histidine kinase
VPATAGQSSRRLITLALAAGGVALGLFAYHVQTEALHLRLHSIATVAVGWSFLLAGLVAWARRPTNRIGPLMILTAFALLARQLRYSDDAFLFTVFFILGDVGYALVGHSALSYPTGRVTDRAERALVIAGYATVLVLPPLTLLFYDGTRQLIGFDPIPRDSLINVTGNADAVELLQKTQIVLFFGVLGALFIALVVRRLWQATPRMRRILAPLLLAAIAVALRAIFECVFTFVDRPFAYDYLFWWQITAFIALPLALLAGLLRARLARTAVGDLVVELEHAPPGALRDALAKTLGDPTLELAFWLPERGTYADAAGRPIELPENGARAVTRLEADGEPLAALVHDPSLLDEPKLVRAAGAAARLALENARLQADMRSQLTQVQESRVRIVAAADEERRRIERDLHDGAQQRLVALALQLRTAQRRLGAGEADPAVEALLASAVTELQVAVDELRELARGVHPAILTEEGLAAALESLGARSALPIELQVLEGRLPAQIEATAYFVICEGLANVAKHAQASKAKVCVSRRNGKLAIEVADDGVGGARPERGSGLSGLADRVEALGGRLRVESPAGGGTRIVSEIPCES